MADFNVTLKRIWNRSVKTVGKAANEVVSATRYKMDEMGGMSRRRELIAELGEKVYALSQANVELPSEISTLLKEVQELDTSLTELRSNRVAAKAAAAEAAAADKAARVAERAADKAARAEAKAAAKAEAEAAKAAAEANAAASVEAVEEEAETNPVLEVEEVEEPVYTDEESNEEETPVIRVMNEN